LGKRNGNVGEGGGIWGDKKMKMKEYKTQCWEEYEENIWSQDRKRKKNIKKVFGMKKKRIRRI
jgi:hypothetical protein